MTLGCAKLVLHSVPCRIFVVHINFCLCPLLLHSLLVVSSFKTLMHWFPGVADVGVDGNVGLHLVNVSEPLMHFVLCSLTFSSSIMFGR